MQQFIKFLVDNWQFVSSASISIVSFILLLIFRRGKTFLFDEGLSECLMPLIMMAESKFPNGHGVDKLNFVINSFFSKYPFRDRSVWEPIIKGQVEYILSCPSKK